MKLECKKKLMKKKKSSAIGSSVTGKGNGKQGS